MVGRDVTVRWDSLTADDLKADIIETIKRDGVYLTPVGFADETGILGTGKLCRAIRGLRDSGAIRLRTSVSGLDEWAMVSTETDKRESD